MKLTIVTVHLVQNMQITLAENTLKDQKCLNQSTKTLKQFFFFYIENQKY